MLIYSENVYDLFNSNPDMLESYLIKLINTEKYFYIIIILNF